jgi:hypothetical protein
MNISIGFYTDLSSSDELPNNLAKFYREFS